MEGREDGISDIFDHLFFFFFFFFAKTLHVYHKEFKSFWVIQVSF